MMAARRFCLQNFILYHLGHHGVWCITNAALSLLEKKCLSSLGAFYVWISCSFGNEGRGLILINLWCINPFFNSSVIAILHYICHSYIYNSVKTDPVKPFIKLKGWQFCTNELFQYKKIFWKFEFKTQDVEINIFGNWVTREKISVTQSNVFNNTYRNVQTTLDQEYQWN